EEVTRDLCFCYLQRLRRRAENLLRPVVFLLSLFVELTGREADAALEPLFEPQAGFEALQGDRPRATIAGQHRVGDARNPTPVKVAVGLTENLGTAERVGIGFIVEEEELSLIVGMIFDEEARAHGTDEGL